jgi:hypothetical protein
VAIKWLGKIPISNFAIPTCGTAGKFQYPQAFLVSLQHFLDEMPLHQQFS